MIPVKLLLYGNHQIYPHFFIEKESVTRLFLLRPLIKYKKYQYTRYYIFSHSYYNNWDIVLHFAYTIHYAEVSFYYFLSNHSDKILLFHFSLL